MNQKQNKDEHYHGTCGSRNRNFVIGVISETNIPDALIEPLMRMVHQKISDLSESTTQAKMEIVCESSNWASKFAAVVGVELGVPVRLLRPVGGSKNHEHRNDENVVGHRNMLKFDGVTSEIIQNDIDLGDTFNNTDYIIRNSDSILIVSDEDNEDEGNRRSIIETKFFIAKRSENLANDHARSFLFRTDGGEESICFVIYINVPAKWSDDADSKLFFEIIAYTETGRKIEDLFRIPQIILN